MDTIKKCVSCKYGCKSDPEHDPCWDCYDEADDFYRYYEQKGELQSGEAHLLTVDELMYIKHGTVVWQEIKGKADLVPMIASDHRSLIGEYEEIRITRKILEPVPLFFGGPMRRRFWAGGIPKEEKRTGAKW